MNVLYIVAAVLVVIAVVALILLGLSGSAAVVLGAAIAVRWLVPHAWRLVRRGLTAAGHALQEIREPSGKHRRIGDKPAVVRIPLCDPATADTQPITRVEETAA